MFTADGKQQNEDDSIRGLGRNGVWVWKEVRAMVVNYMHKKNESRDTTVSLRLRSVECWAGGTNGDEINAKVALFFFRQSKRPPARSQRSWVVRAWAQILTSHLDFMLSPSFTFVIFPLECLAICSSLGLGS